MPGDLKKLNPLKAFLRLCVISSQLHFCELVKNYKTRGGASHSSMDSVLASHPAALGLILANIFFDSPHFFER